MDFISDPNPRALNHLKELGVVPDFVKESSTVTLEKCRAANKAGFADRENRHLPIFDKEATYLSCVYYYGHRDRDPVLEETLEKAASFFGIASEVKEARLHLRQTLNKQASINLDEVFALSLRLDDDRIRRFYPIRDEFELCKSAVDMDAALVERRLPPELFREASLRVVKRAAELNVADHRIPRTIRLNGINQLPDFDNARSAVLMRKQAGVEDEAIGLYEALVESARLEGNVDKAAALMARLDEVNDLDYRDVPTPYEAFFGSGKLKIEELEKAAETHVVIGHAMVPREIVSKIPVEKMAYFCGRDTLEEVRAVVKAAETDAPRASMLAEKLSPEVQKRLLSAADAWVR